MPGKAYPEGTKGGEAENSHLAPCGAFFGATVNLCFGNHF